MANFKKVKECGFTILELIIMVAIVLLFTGFSIGYYGQYTEQKKLESASRKVSSLLDLMRAKTISGDSSLCGMADPTAVKVEYFSFSIINGGEYSLQPKCAAGTPTPIYYITETNIVFPTPTLSIPFFSVSGGTRCNYIYIKNTSLSGSNACRFVKVSSTGLISEDSCSSCDTCPTTCP